MLFRSMIEPTETESKPTLDEFIAAMKEADELSVREFWHGVARLGGFIGRKSDGDPGWQTLWRGWQRLQDLCWGLEFS